MSGMRVVVSGFTAFHGRSENPSEHLIRFLLDHPIQLNEIQVFPLILPVEFQKVEAAFDDAIQTYSPHLWLAFGVAPQTIPLRLEKIGFNRDHSSAPDNSGEIRLNQQILSDGPDQASPCVKLESLQARLADDGFQVGLSEDAGTYVCNHLLYYALNSKSVSQQQCHFLFSHIAPIGCGYETTQLSRLVQTVVGYFHKHFEVANNSRPWNQFSGHFEGIV